MRWFKKQAVDDYIQRAPQMYPMYPNVYSKDPYSPYTLQIAQPWGDGMKIEPGTSKGQPTKVELNNEDILTQPGQGLSQTVTLPWTQQVKDDSFYSEPEPAKYQHSYNEVELYRTRANKGSNHSYNIDRKSQTTGESMDDLKWYRNSAANEITPQLQDIIHRIITEISSKIPDINKTDILEIIHAYRFEPAVEDMVFEEILRFFDEQGIEITQNTKETQEIEKETPKKDDTEQPEMEN